MDISNPPEHQMEEMLSYRTKKDERAKVWSKLVGNTILMGCRESGEVKDKSIGLQPSMDAGIKR